MNKNWWKLFLVIVILLVTLQFILDEAAFAVNNLDAAVQEFDEIDFKTAFNIGASVLVKLSEHEIICDDSGVEIDGSIIRIITRGTYIFTGTVKGGQIVVDTGSSDLVHIILNGVDISHSACPIYVKKAGRVIITLAEASENILTSLSDHDPDSERPNAVIFSQNDLTINGTGKLIVDGNHRHGIISRENLKIISGVLNVNAVADGIKGKMKVGVTGGDIVIICGNDGVESSKGYVYIEKGSLDITSGGDGIQAETNAVIKGGNIRIRSSGGSPDVIAANTFARGPFNPRQQIVTTAEKSAKGIKAKVDVIIDGGEIKIDSLDDGLHSDDLITLNSGNIWISTGDDGIHADNSFTANGGNVEIVKSYEGIEAKTITFNAGIFRVASVDDGINGTSQNNETANPWQMRQPMGGQQGADLFINGGHIVVNADGDGIDVNGNIEMTGGCLIIYGPLTDFNAAVDYDGTFRMAGGFLLAAGSMGMAQAPGADSTQKSLCIVMTDNVFSGTLVHITSESGEEIVTFKAVKPFQSLVVSSPLIKKDVSYKVYTGGTYQGDITDGICTNGNYTAGNQVASISTKDAFRQGMGMGGPGRRMPRW